MTVPPFALVAGLVVGSAAVLSGCSGSQDRAAATAAEEFYAAVGSGDGSAACELLAPRAREELEQSSGMPCDRAVLEEGLPADGSVGTTEVYGTMARVDYGADTVFLSEFDAGWRVVASGCTFVADALPYDCRVKAG